MDLRTSATNPMNLPRAKTVGELIDLLAETRRLGMLGHLYKIMEELDQARYAAGDRRVTMVPQEREYSQQTYADLPEAEMNSELFMPRNIDPQVKQYFLQNIPGGIPSPEMPSYQVPQSAEQVNASPKMEFAKVIREGPYKTKVIETPEKGKVTRYLDIAHYPVDVRRRGPRILRSTFSPSVSTGVGDDFVRVKRWD